MHGPAIVLYFLGAATVGFCTLQKSVLLGSKARYILILFMLALVISYIAQGIYYFGYTVAPQHSVFNIIFSILIWGSLMLVISRTKSTLWQPYCGAFVVQVLFEGALCVLSDVSISTHDRLSNTPLGLGALRVLLSFGLMVHGFLVQFGSHEQHVDEEAQPLLRDNAGYGSISSREITERRQKWLEQEGGWFGYLKGFALFFRYLWPRDDFPICLVTMNGSPRSAAPLYSRDAVTPSAPRTLRRPPEPHLSADLERRDNFTFPNNSRPPYRSVCVNRFLDAQ
jgi:hypothetical protein